MKTRILTAVLLMFALTTFAQTSRRSDQERKSTTRTTQDNNNKKAEVKSDNNSRRSYTTQPASNNRQEVKKESTNTRRENNTYGNSRGNDNNNNRSNDNNNRGNDNYKRDNHRNVPTQSRPTTVVVKHEPRHNREYVRIVRPERKVVVVHSRPGYHPRPVEYRRVHYAYRAPVVRNIVWSISLHNEFRIFYPEIRVWRYHYGYRIPEISAYDAELYIGDVARVYGKVWEVYYDYNSDNYFLYIGDYYPYHDFSIVMPGHEARKFTRRPERYFEGSHVAVTGYITEFENKPEIVVRRANQVDLY